MSTFYLRNPKGNKETLILFSSYFKKENKKFVYSTGEKIHPSEWDFKLRMPNDLNGRTERAENHKSIKLQLDRYANFLISITNVYRNARQELTLAKVREEFDQEFKRVSTGKNKFYEAYEDFMSYKIKNKDWSKATIKRYINIKNTLKDFEKNRNYKLTFNTITDKFYTEFTDFCMNEKNHINNTFSRNVGLLKTFLFWALENKYTYKADFIKFKKKPRVITNQIALSKEDIQELLKAELDCERLERVRDVFVFSCVTGMRFGELKLISKNNITENTLLLKEEKESTKVSRHIPLNQIAMYLLRKYNYKLPLITNQKHNDYLKEIFKKIGYTHDVERTSTRGKEVIREIMPFYDRISSHTARRTFITMMKRKGKSDKLIAKISGHKDMKTLNQYYQVSNNETQEAVRETFDLEIPLKKVD